MACTRAVVTLVTAKTGLGLSVLTPYPDICEQLHPMQKEMYYQMYIDWVVGTTIPSAALKICVYKITLQKTSR